jgi:hypothetical protein
MENPALSQPGRGLDADPDTRPVAPAGLGRRGFPADDLQDALPS